LEAALMFFIIRRSYYNLRRRMRRFSREHPTVMSILEVLLGCVCFVIGFCVVWWTWHWYSTTTPCQRKGTC
jgi:hypothetical protein